MNSTITELKVLISDTILDSDTSRGFHIPKVKSYLPNSQIEAIASFIKDQKNKDVNFKIDDKDEVDIKGHFEATKIIYDYYKNNEKVLKSDIKNLLEALKLCSKHLKKFDSFNEFRKLLEIQDSKYFHEYDLEDYRYYFNDSLVQSLKKQSSKYPVLLFSEVVTTLDGINKKGYKNKNTRLAQELKKLILNIFDMKASVLRVEDTKEYEPDIEAYREAIKFYFETLRRYIGNESIVDGSRDITPDQYDSLCFVAYPLKNYERLGDIEKLHKESFGVDRLKKLEIFNTIKEDTKKYSK